MSFQIEIDDETVDHASGIRKDGQPWEVFKQGAWLHYGSKHPVFIQLQVQDSKPHPAGRYNIAPGSLGSDKFGNPEFGKIKIRPVATGNLTAMGKS